MGLQFLHQLRYAVINFGRFSFDCSPLDSITKVKLAITLFSDLVGVTDHYNADKILKFFLTVCKNYRPVSYHNWDHAFSVAHCMYWVISQGPQMFSESEVKNLMENVLTCILDNLFVVMMVTFMHTCFRQNSLLVCRKCLSLWHAYVTIWTTVAPTVHIYQKQAPHWQIFTPTQSLRTTISTRPSLCFK